MHIIIIIILAELKMIQGKLSFKRNITKSIILKLIYLKRCTITFFDRRIFFKICVVLTCLCFMHIRKLFKNWGNRNYFRNVSLKKL